MTKFKKIIIFVIVIVVIIIAMLILSIDYLNSGNGTNKEFETSSDEEILNNDTPLQLVTLRNDFYAVKTCVEKFYMYYSTIYDSEDNYNEIDGKSIEAIQQENKDAVYSMLDKDYINYKGITSNNIDEKMNELKYSVVNINEMYVSKRDPNMYIYIIKGKLRELKTAEISDFKIMIKLDALNKTFKVFLDDYLEQNYGNIKLNDKIDIDVEKSINEDVANIYDYKFVDDETYVTDLFNKYKDEILFDSENAYAHLNEQYRNKRFETLDNFKKYLKDNITKNVMMEIDKFQKNVYEDYTEFVCMDQNGNYYIFNENAVMNYDLILDTYTVNLPSFIKKYDQGDEQIKVGMNIEKVISAINVKDYKYVYNKLDESFKNNNFGSLDNFVQFIENTFYERNEVEYETFTDVGGVFIYTLNVKDTNNLEQENEVKIVIKLLDDRDFVMSFNV